jgi:hypothetical protein
MLFDDNDDDDDDDGDDDENDDDDNAPDQQMTISSLEDLLMKSRAMIAERLAEPIEDEADENGNEDEDEADEADAQPADIHQLEVLMKAIAAAPDSSKPVPGKPVPEPKPDRPLNPPDISRWQESLEKRLVKQLQQISDQMNKLMQTAKVLPGKLPSAILEVAAKADFSSDLTNSIPNVMTLMIEARTAKQKDRRSQNLTQVMAVRLRLAEIELTDLTISVLRSQIRSLLSRLSKLKKDHQRLEKEKAIAEAEAAWRSSWFEES